ncbi:alpha/beta fold hydrolase [Rhizobium sp. RCC_161_2]|uniref:alpha/beta fold hydrolase n=1 Tax=Rhizobium sp. RCC_161_2 TaxID=3239219 RepID=UPI00352406A3
MKSLRLETEQANLGYHDLPGSGLPLVFIHGLGGASSCDYPTVAADPALTGRRMLLVDLLGSGFSDRPTDFGYTIDLHARTIVQLVGHLGFQSIDLFGHSMGGAVAIAAARLLGNRVQHLVLSEPNLAPGGGIFSRGIAETPEADYVARGHDDLVRKFAGVEDGTWAASLAVSAPYAVHRGASSLVAGSSPTWGEQLYALPMPRTLIFGSRTLPHPDAEGLPRDGVNIEIVPDAGHSMPWDNPVGLASAIGRAIA